MDVLLSVPVVFEAGVACMSTVGMTGPYEHELLFRTYVHDYHDSSGSLGSTSVFRPAVFIPRARFIIDSPAAVFCNVRCAPFCDGADGEKRVDTQGRGDRGAVNYIQAHTSRGGRQCQNCRKTTVLCGCIPPTKHRRPSSNHPTDEWCLAHRGRTPTGLCKRHS